MLLPATTDIMIKTKRNIYLAMLGPLGNHQKKMGFLKATDLKKDVFLMSLYITACVLGGNVLATCYCFTHSL